VPTWPSCKPERLCDRVDIDILERCRGQSIADYDRITRSLAHGASAAHILIAGCQFPEDPAEFIALLRRIHHRIFSEALPEMAGRFRRIGEDVEFGGQHGNRLVGAPSDQIGDRLIRLYAKSLTHGFASRDLTRLADQCAKFLEQFFRIHPFVDGNGRVGRLMIKLACERTGEIYLDRLDTSPSSRRRYIKALEYAHRHALESDHPDRKSFVNPYFGLARWIRGHLHLKPLDPDLEADPPPE
jgi:fido (protein-threonine AMPylation protein)